MSKDFTLFSNVSSSSTNHIERLDTLVQVVLLPIFDKYCGVLPNGVSISSDLALYLNQIRRTKKLPALLQPKIIK